MRRGASWAERAGVPSVLGVLGVLAFLAPLSILALGLGACDLFSDRTPCAVDAECASSERCGADGFCGAGARDGGSDLPRDAGPDDAGADAGLEDAGIDDAGVDDAGIEDAGIDDAGIDDAGIDDAGRQVPADWVDVRFRRRLPIALDGSIVDDDVVNLPLLVTVGSADVDMTALRARSGADLRFFADDGGLLTHEIENLDVDGAAVLWVRVPRLAANTETRIALYFDFVGPGAPPAVDPTLVWNDYRGVWHLDEDMAGGAVVVRDSTAGGRDGIATVDGAEGKEGIAGRGQGFDGTDSVDLQNIAAWNLSSSGASFELWFRSRGAQLGEFARLFTRFQGGVPGSGYFGAFRNNLLLSEWRAQGEVLRAELGNTGPALDGAWHHYTYVADLAARRAFVYLDGALVAEDAFVPPLIDETGQSLILGGPTGVAVGFFGSLDEFRVSAFARPAAYVKANHAAMAGTLASSGDEERLP
jgi:hypothetical protein